MSFQFSLPCACPIPTPTSTPITSTEGAAALLTNFVSVTVGLAGQQIPLNKTGIAGNITYIPPGGVVIEEAGTYFVAVGIALGATVAGPIQLVVEGVNGLRIITETPSVVGLFFEDDFELELQRGDKVYLRSTAAATIVLAASLAVAKIS